MTSRLIELSLPLGDWGRAGQQVTGQERWCAVAAGEKRGRYYIPPNG